MRSAAIDCVRRDPDAVIEHIPVTDLRARADDGEAADVAAGAELGPLADDRARRRSCRSPTTAPAPITDDSIDGAPPITRAGADHGEAPDAGARADRRSRADETGGTRRAPGSTSAPSASERVVGAERVADLGAEVPLEHVAVRLEIALGRADVEPVAGSASAEHGPSSTSRGNTSRSIETGRPGGIRSSTSGSST